MPEQPERSSCRAVVLLGGRPRPPAAVEQMFRRAGVEIVGYAQTAAGALSLLGRRKPDTLVAEGALTDDPDDEEAFLRRAYEVDPSLTGILIADGLSSLEQALFAAAAAYAGHQDEGDDPAAAPGKPAGPQLTRRELEVLELAAQGLSNAQIAKRLWVTRDTVKFHLANVFRKLGAGSRLEAARLARERGLLEG